MRSKKQKALTRDEVRNRKEADRKKKEAEALEMRQARRQRQRAEEKEERREKEERIAREKEEIRARQKGKPRYRKLRNSGGPRGIPEHTPGYPRSGTNFNTDEDIKKGRKRYDG